MQSTYIKPQARKVHDANVTFEEYYYYAQKTRAEEQGLKSPKLNWRQLLLRKKSENEAGEDSHESTDAAKNVAEVNFANRENRMEISDEEWTNASRAYRTASWGAAFYLVSLQLIVLLGPYLRSVRSPPTYWAHTGSASHSEHWVGDLALRSTQSSASSQATPATSSGTCTSASTAMNSLLGKYLRKTRLL